MKTLFAFLGIAIFFPFLLFAQGDNCSDPKAVAFRCSGAVYNGETTAGYTNDFNAGGNDIVYRIDVPTGVDKIFVSVTRLSAPLFLIFNGTNCSTFYGSITNVNAPIDNYTYNVTGGYSYYIIVDHANPTDITYDIAFGYETSTVVGTVSIPDTRGKWGKSTVRCVSPSTQVDADVTYNGVHKDFPVTFSPLNTSGVLCARYFYENRTGQQGVKRFEFTFNASYVNVSPVVTSMPGFYNAGIWTVVGSGNKYVWYFTDQAGLGYGDAPGTAGTCFGYQFCFNVTPVNNDPVGTKIITTAYADNRGAGYIGPLYDGCCASRSCSGAAAGSGSASATTTINDPPLPVTFVSFDGEAWNGTVALQWATAVEENVRQFEIERSVNGTDFEVIGAVEAKGTSSTLIHYSFSDAAVAVKGAYYRIRSVDMDGYTERSKMIYVSIHSASVKVFPNPAKAVLTVESPAPMVQIQIRDTKGEAYYSAEGKGDFLHRLDITEFPQGIYYVVIQTETDSFTARFFKE